MWSRNCLHFRKTWAYPAFQRFYVARSLVFCVMFCRSLCVLLSFFFWSLYCLSFFDLRVLISPLISSNFSYEEMSCDSIDILSLDKFCTSCQQNIKYKTKDWATRTQLKNLEWIQMLRNSRQFLLQMWHLSYYSC